MKLVFTCCAKKYATIGAEIVTIAIKFSNLFVFIVVPFVCVSFTVSNLT